MSQVEQKIRDFLSKYIKNRELSGNDDIFSLGFVNSLFAMQLVMQLEKDFGIKIETDDLDIKNFSTVNAMVELVNQKA